jgi:Holliday junction DNA helicase RuvA
MIARLRGRPVGMDEDGLVLDVNGVGYRLLATASALEAAMGRDEVTLETHLYVRDDALQLFGFATVDERRLFEQLQSVAGIGPKVALAIVSAYAPGELRRAIVLEDAALFQSVPGIGRKLAQRVVLELKEKIGPLAPVAGPPAAGAGDGHLVAREALVELGYSVAEAEQRLSEVDPDLPPSERVRQALKAA